MKKIYFSVLALAGVFASAQVYDVGNGAQVMDLSNTGVAVGNFDGAVHFMWTEGSNPQIIGNAGENGVSGNETITADGNKISATNVNPENGIEEAAIYDSETGEWTYLGGLGTVLDGDTSSSWGLSSNGEHIVGMAWVEGGRAHGVLWSEDQEIVDLGSTVSTRSSRANSVTPDGSRVVGWQDSEIGYRQGVYWENGEQHLLTDNDGVILGEALSISADGKTITGITMDGKGYIWNEDEGTITYNHFAGHEFEDDYFTSVSGISDDGTTAVGFSFTPFEGMLFGKSFIWTKEEGFKDLGDYVTEELGYDDLDIQFSVATAISPDGQYLGGVGANFVISEVRGFVIKRPGQMGTQDQGLMTKTSVYPNPVKETLNFKSEEKINSVEILSMVGQNVMKAELSNNSLNVAHLTKGVYFVKVKTDKGVQTIKFIKQ